MEQTRQEMRQLTLDAFKYVRTCVLARELCLLVCANRAVLHAEDVRECCGFIASLCREARCEEPSGLCAEAAQAVTEGEERYLQLCGRSRALCYGGRPPAEPRPERAPYIT